DADIAMYKAKGSSREYAIFDAPMHALVVQQMQIENDLRRALERSELRLFYQPIVDLVTGATQGFEALVRWQHPQRGLVPPLDFIPIAENLGLITALDLWTLNQACWQLSQWQRQFAASQQLTVSVNLSGKQFVRPDLIQQIDSALARNGLQGKHLKVEITESVLIQNAQLAIDLLKQLRQRHIQVCMDDFGTGYSSLSYLHRFPIDVLKIDKSFVTPLHNPEPVQGDYEIVKAIISLATSLNLTVIAEGIETAKQARYLKAHRCQSGQGYYFSKPLSVESATALIDQINASSPAKTETACRESTGPIA
ncbi:MAG: EAL domain-containing protein, partial [Nodosilinea sp.]